MSSVQLAWSLQKLVNDRLLHHGQRHLQHALVTVELGTAFVFVYIKGQELIQHEIRRLYQNLPIFHVKLHLAEFGVRKPHLHQHRIVLTRIFVRHAQEHVLCAHVLHMLDLVVGRGSVVRQLLRFDRDFLLSPDLVFGLCFFEGFSRSQDCFFWCAAALRSIIRFHFDLGVGLRNLVFILLASVVERFRIEG